LDNKVFIIDARCKYEDLRNLTELCQVTKTRFENNVRGLECLNMHSFEHRIVFATSAGTWVRVFIYSVSIAECNSDISHKLTIWS